MNAFIQFHLDVNFEIIFYPVVLVRVEHKIVYIFALSLWYFGSFRIALVARISLLITLEKEI